MNVIGRGIAISIVSLLLCAGCAPRKTTAADAGAGSDEPFWTNFEIDGDWVEFAPSLRELAAKADVVAIGHVSKIREILTNTGDSGSEDVFFEAVLDIEMTTVLESDQSGTVGVTLVAPNARSRIELMSRLADKVPDDEVVVMLRRRKSGLYVPINGYGLWTLTPRRELDCPLNPEPPTEGVYASEISSLRTARDLFDYLKSSP